MADAKTAPSTTKVAPAVTAHAWNKDGSMIALSANNAEVWIYQTNGGADVSKWKKVYTLKEHTSYITGIDWSPVTNLIVTCGHDRNAYVWKHDSVKDTWTPALVILRIQRAATQVKWSPSGHKFAVTSGAKLVPICHYEETGNWWISKMIRGPKSTVMSVAWCPNSKFVVVGACDFKCRIYSAYIEGLDPADDDGFGEVFPKQHEFGEALAEFNQCKGWVQSVAWSPGAFRVAFAGHDSTVCFVQLLAKAKPTVQIVHSKGLPFIDIEFLSDNCLVGAGYELNPTAFTASGTDSEPQWAFKAALDKEEEKKDVASPQKGSDVGNIRDKWKQADNQKISMQKKGTSIKAIFKTRHQNQIMGIFVLGDANADKRSSFSTCALDGQVLEWDLAKMGHDLAALCLK